MPVTGTDHAELAGFCGGFPELAATAAAEGWSAELDEVAARLRAGEPPASVLVPFWRGLGLVRDPRGPARLPGQAPTAPPPGGYRCPRRVCDRVQHRAPGGPLPECAVFDEPLRFGR
jgi:hypothetical protein